MLKAILLAGSCVLSTLSMSGLASAGFAVTPWTKIGDTVTNPVTNADVTVLELINDPYGELSFAATSDGNTILAKTQVGDFLNFQNGATVDKYKVISVVTNAASGLVESVNLRLSTLLETNPTTTKAVVVATGADYGVPDSDKGAPGLPEYTPPIKASGVINEVSRGANGGNGNDGYRVRICDPFFGLGCTTIGYGGTGGGAGQNGPTVNRTITAAHGLITGTANTTPGITIGSVGGNGGQGGDACGALPAKPGGNGGAGGSVTVNNQTGVNISGKNSYGLYVFSRSGAAGSSGTGYGFSDGGTGTAATDGAVNVTNSDAITTSGEGAHGIYGLSVGGSAGSGEGSWGIVGGAGNGANGGTVTITNSGIIHTYGKSAHGILAQSGGGSGGTGGGLAAIGGSGGVASNAGNVEVNAGANSLISTTGRYSTGIYAQSVGGGGDTGGSSGGLVAIGGSGSGGGEGGTATVTSSEGFVTTTGNDAVAIFTQSVRGGGGTGGMNVTGVFAKNSSPINLGIGSFGSGGGHAGSVDVIRGSAGTPAGRIFTNGTGAIGI